MNEKRIYDFPTRVFHWLFALSFIIAFTIGNTVDDDAALFSYHMLSGLVLCFLLTFRIPWGL
ncbi:MAG: cytochrome b/b6 domain-containing protein, partial [Bdellovibrionales bacterium]|nr:cytochrome b/b6 domain-containing protein [Bdellovibrionales bacterium]